MKKVGIAILLLISALAWGKPNPANYTVAVHVQSSQLVTACDDWVTKAICGLKQHLQVVIDGKKFELNSNGNSETLLRTGDYKARLLVDDQESTDTPPPAYEIRITTTYELLFPDGKTRKYRVVGESE